MDDAQRGALWLVGGAFGISLAALGVGFAPAYPLVLVSLSAMGTCDGLTIVAENGIMQRRTPDAIRSRTMAAFEAVLSLGLAVAYLLAGPVLEAIGPRAIYVVGGAAAFAAACLLFPLRRLQVVEQASEGVVAASDGFTLERAT